MPGHNLHSVQSCLVSVGLFLFLISLGCAQTEVLSQGSDYIPIHLAIGSFDPLYQSAPIALPLELTIERYPEGEAGYYILQFKGPVLDSWKKAILSTGTRLFDYIPRFAFIAKMDNRTREVVRSMDPVRWIGIYQPGYRVAPGLLSASPEKGEEPVEVFVSVFAGEDLRSLSSAMRHLGGEIVQVSETGERVRLKIPSRRIPAVSRLTGVKWIESVPEIKIFPSIQGRFDE